MARKKQINTENGAVLNRDFPRQGRSLIIGAEELRRLFPNVKPEYIDLAIKRLDDYRFGDNENEIGVFGKILIAVIIQDALAQRRTAMGILEELWYGNLSPCERDFKKGSKYSELLGYIVRASCRKTSEPSQR